MAQNNTDLKDMEMALPVTDGGAVAEPSPQGDTGEQMEQIEVEVVQEEGEEPSGAQTPKEEGKKRPRRRWKRADHTHEQGRLSAIIIGIVFFFAGIFKLIDPVGAGLVVEEYFNFFGTGFLLPAAKVFAVLLALLETVTGLALLTGVYRKLTAIVAYAFILAFTIITFLLYRSGQQFDCGCFGEAIHLTTAQTFWKNIVLLVLSVFAFIPFSRLGKGTTHKKIAFYIVVTSVLALTVYSLLNIPVIDFTDFRPSTALHASRIHRAELTDDETETLYLYTKDGVERRFRLSEIPDGSWTYVGEIKENVNEIDDSQTPSLPIMTTEGEVCDSIAVGPYIMVVSVNDPRKMKAENWEKVASLLDESSQSGFTPLLLASIPPGGSLPLPEGVSPMARYLLEEHLYCSDHRTLLSLNRSNGGAVYFSEGYLIRKWPIRDYPTMDELLKIHEEDPTDGMLTQSSAGRLRFQVYILAVIAIVALV